MTTYYHENHKDFIDKYNIINGELTSQTKLNRSVNVLKKESTDNYNRLEIFRGQFALLWNDFTLYKEGEIVSFISNVGLPSEIQKNYSVKIGMDNTNIIPDVNPLHWEEVTIDNYLMPLNSVIMSQYLNTSNITPYTPTDDYHPSTKLYVDESVKVFYVGNDPLNGFNFLALDNITPYVPTLDYHPATKLYFDTALNDALMSGTVNVATADNANNLGLRDASEFITVYRDFNGAYNGMAVKNGALYDSLNATDWIRTPANGLIPYDQNKGSDLGSEFWQFREVHSVDFFGNYNSASADIAEIYESDLNYEPGTVLEIGTNTEVTIYNNGILAGVVSTNPGVILNKNALGVKVALKGRVPVKIEGSAKRGQYINTHKNGLGIACDYKTDRTIGVCITPGKNTVEVKI